MRFRLLFLFLILYSIPILAQESESEPPFTVQEIDSVAYGLSNGDVIVDSIIHRNYVTDNTVYPKALNPNFRNKYKGPEFDYTTIKPKESLWEKIEKRIKKILRAIFGDSLPKQANEFITVIFRILAVIIVGLVLYFLISYLLSKDGNFIFGKKNKKINLNATNLNENIHEINFGETILSFEKKKDYRSAIRYHYLSVLKKLSDKKLIEWNPEKTNKDYVSEYSVAASKDHFRNLSYIFDYVWYGEFDIDEESYVQFKSKFENFKV